MEHNNRPRRRLLDYRPEMAQFVAQHGWGFTCTDLLAEMARRFPNERMPSRSALHRYMNAIGRSGRLFGVEFVPEVAAFVRQQQRYMTLDGLCEAMRREFPGVKLPGRSSVYRFITSARRRERHAPEASTNPTARMEEIENTLRAIQHPERLLQEWRTLYEGAHRPMRGKSFPEHVAQRLGVSMRTIRRWMPMTGDSAR